MSEAMKTPEPKNAAANAGGGGEQAAAAATTEASPQVEKKTPSKRGRMSFIQRAQMESEELVKTLGGSLEMEGGRRTRSSARGTPSTPTVATPPPTKKSRNSPASPKAATPRGRGRGRKLETSVTPEPPEVPKPKTSEPEAAEKETAENVEKSETETEQKSAAEVAAKTKESSETNGPEKAEKEVEAAKTAEKAEKSEKTETTAAKPNEKKADTAAAAGDQVDAVAAAPKLAAIEEKHTQELAEKTEKSKAEEIVAIADSPMDVDEQSKSNEEAVAAKSKEVEKSNDEVAPAATAAPTAALDTAAKPQIEKLPSPEPMEVDSSSKSSDVIECTDVVDKAADDAVETAANKNSTTNDIISTNSHAADKPPTTTTPPAAAAVEPEHKNEINANVKANDVPAAIKTIAAEPVAVAEPHVDNNKNENDLDQQKLASQVNAAPAAAAAGGDAVTSL